jgi:hypothetical protein
LAHQQSVAQALFPDIEKHRPIDQRLFEVSRRTNRLDCVRGSAEFSLRNFNSQLPGSA